LARALPKRIVKGGFPPENRGAAVENAIAYGRADTEAVTLVCLNDQFAAFEGHQNPAIALHRLNGEVENESEELRQRPVAGQFVTGTDERGNVIRCECFGGL